MKNTISASKDTATEIFINDIKQKIRVMKRSQYRTTNFSLIEYFADNNFKPLNLQTLVSKIIRDYKSNPKRYVLAHDNVPFKSEANFKMSIQSSIKRNKVFFRGPVVGMLSVNLKRVSQYLNTMYGRYISNSKDVKTPIKMFHKKTNNKEIQDEVPTINLNSDETNESDNDENEPIIIEQSSEPIQNNNINNNANNDISTSQSNIDAHLNKNEYNKNDYAIKEGKSSNYDFNGNINKYFENLENNFNDENDIEDNTTITNNKDKNTVTNNNSTITINNQEYKKDQIILNKEDDEDPNDEILQKLKKIYFISSFKKEFLYKILVDSMEKSQKNKNANINNNDKEKKGKIISFLKMLYEKKKSYEKFSFQIKSLEEEIIYIIKFMKQNMKSIIWEINDKSYTYQSYLKLQENISNYDKIFNNIVDVIEQKILLIINLEEISLCIKSNIQNCFNSEINNEFLRENNFKDYIDAIMEANDNNEANLSIINIWRILKKMKDEKKLINDETNKIDDDIGNISINEMDID